MKEIRKIYPLKLNKDERATLDRYSAKLKMKKSEYIRMLIMQDANQQDIRDLQRNPGVVI